MKKVKIATVQEVNRALVQFHFAKFLLSSFQKGTNNLKGVPRALLHKRKKASKNMMTDTKKT